MTDVRGFVRRRMSGTYTIDEWGLDTDVVDLLSPAFGARWSIDVVGDATIPADGPVLLVFSRRFGLSEPFVLARGVRLATGRHVRMTGAPDIAPVGPALRRVGAVLERPDEIAGLLRADQVVAVALGASSRRHHAGTVGTDLVAPALATRALVVPVAVIGREVGRHWRVLVGAPVEHPTTRGPLAAADLAERARAGVQALLDDAFPPSLFRTA
jgi:hypothetical protein